MKKLKWVRYFLKEVRTSIKKELAITILISLCIVCSCIFMFFYFGYIRHMQQKKIDSEFGENCFYVYFYDPGWPLERKLEIVRENKVKKGDLVEWLLGLDEKILADVEVTLECKFEEDVVDDAAIDNSCLSFATEFIIRNGMILPPRIEETLKSKNFLIKGRYFVDDDYLNGEYVCISPAYESANFEEEYEYLKDRYVPDENGDYTIDGKKYTSIGVLDSFSAIPDVPVTTIRDDIFVKNITFVFEHPVTRYEYEKIAGDLYARYGEQAMVSPMDIKTVDGKRFDITIFMMLVVVSVFSMIIVSFLFEYMIVGRKECIRTFKLCGMDRKYISYIYICKGMFMAAIACVISAVLYHYTILPVLEKKFEYLRNAAGISVYMMMGSIFMVISYLFFKLTVIRRSN